MRESVLLALVRSVGDRNPTKEVRRLGEERGEKTFVEEEEKLTEVEENEVCARRVFEAHEPEDEDEKLAVLGFQMSRKDSNENGWSEWHW